MESQRTSKGEGFSIYMEKGQRICNRVFSKIQAPLTRLGCQFQILQKRITKKYISALK
jgi:hypothetical protein